MTKNYSHYSLIVVVTSALFFIPSLDASWASNISSLMLETNSIWLQLLLSLLLGTLLSFTPCIYPMIPITIGILGGGTSSVGRNFTRALAYTLGIATTFATLGIMAAFTGQLFGSFMNNPFVILGIAALMTYLGLSMIGLYNMYIPRFMQGAGTSSKPSGSIFGAFVFGAISGTVASPCLSPGLVLLLGIVTALGSKILGFALLFSFGVGLSIPLLIIGTFSSSLSVLPQAGMWMNEVKEFFGFLLLGMALYFLSSLLSDEVIMWLLGSSLLLVGLYYLFTSQKTPSTIWRTIRIIIGLAAFIGAAYIYMNTCSTCSDQECSDQQSYWFLSYADALVEAQKTHKNIFVDITGPHCSICKAIDKKLLQQDQVVDALLEMIPVKLDTSDTDNETHMQLLKEFKVIGTPTFLIIDPHTGKELQRWGAELYEINPDTFIEMLAPYKK